MTEEMGKEAAALSKARSNVYTAGSAISRYQTDHGGKVPAILTELKPKYLTTIDFIQTSQIGYKVNKSKTEGLVYTLIPDKDFATKPFIVWGTEEGFGHYSQAELDAWGK